MGPEPAPAVGSPGGGPRETGSRPLLGFEFIGLCVVAFLAVANGTSYYNLFGHLEGLGVPGGLRGVVVGAYSLTAMALYLLASPFITPRVAPRVMLGGIAVLVAGGLGWLVVRSFWALLLLRAFCGAGHFLMGAGATALLVTVIPAARSGQAFGLYSVAILLAYGIVPAAMDAIVPWLGSPPRGYAAATLALLPAAWIVLRLRRRIPGPAPQRPPPGRTPHAELWANVSRPPVALLLLLNVAYFTNWSSLYYLYKGFAEERQLGNVGSFLSVLTAVMVLIRLVAGRLFDRFHKARLAAVSFGVIAVSHLALRHLPGGAVPLVGALFGLGLGADYPALNGLMFDLSEPRLRPQNANLMLFAVQAGSFLGPAAGGALVVARGYPSYFLAAAGLAVLSAAASAALSRVRPPRPVALS